MYVHQYQKLDRLWTVGYFDPGGAWHAVSDHESSNEATDEVARLNGGQSGITDDQITDIKDAIFDAMPRALLVSNATLKQTAADLDALRACVVNLLAAWEKAEVYRIVGRDQAALDEALLHLATLRMKRSDFPVDSQ